MRSPPLDRFRVALNGAPARRWRRLVRRHRRRLLVLAVALSTLAGLHAAAPRTPPLVPELVAADDLAGGQLLEPTDVRVARVPGRDRAVGTLIDLADAVGRTLAAPVRKDEPLTDVRLVGPGLLSTLAPGDVATPLRLADAGAAALVRPGDRVDVLAAPADPASRDRTRVAATDVGVLAVPAAPASAVQDGALVVLATSRPVALALAAAAAVDRLSVSLLPAAPGPSAPSARASPAGR